jgi:hypothetical protein
MENDIKQLEEINEIYFSNYLKTFLIYISQDLRYDNLDLIQQKLQNFIYQLRMDKIIENYEIKCFRRYCFILNQSE